MEKEKRVRMTAPFHKRPGHKIYALLLAVLLSFGGVVGGTVAWLIADTDPVVNTFTYGDINITLDEAEIGPDGEPVKDPEGNPIRKPEGNDYVMVPGNTIKKDPKVTVLSGNEDCWLFVKLEKSGGNVTVGEATYSFDDFLEYDLLLDNQETPDAIEGWQPLTDAAGTVVEGVYYYQVDADTDSQPAEYYIIQDNEVRVKESVTKEMLNALDATAGSEVYPVLKLTAYAVQRDANIEAIDTAIEAWELAQSSN